MFLATFRRSSGYARIIRCGPVDKVVKELSIDSAGAVASLEDARLGELTTQVVFVAIVRPSSR
jgi:hypothetical protein